MDISLLEIEENLSFEKIAVLKEIMDKSEVDMSKLAKEVQAAIVWCLIRAFEFGHTTGRIELIDELKSELMEMIEPEKEN